MAKERLAHGFDFRKLWHILVLPQRAERSVRLGPRFCSRSDERWPTRRAIVSSVG
jgi:hypothetical protein